MRWVPSITFTEGPAGRRAAIAGTGPDVWQVIATWQDVPRITPKCDRHTIGSQNPQLLAVLEYCNLYACRYRRASSYRGELDGGENPRRISVYSPES